MAGSKKHHHIPKRTNLGKKKKKEDGKKTFRFRGKQLPYKATCPRGRVNVLRYRLGSIRKVFPSGEKNIPLLEKRGILQKGRKDWQKRKRSHPLKRPAKTRKKKERPTKGGEENI